MTNEIYSAVFFEEDINNIEIEYKITVLAKFHQCDEFPEWEVMELFCDNKPVDAEELATKLYKWDNRLRSERAMTVSELETKIIEALNNQFDDTLPF